jgi:hypothetical protein
MITTALVTADPKLVFQIQSWIKELGDAIRLRTFSDLESLAITSADDDLEKEEPEDPDDSDDDIDHPENTPAPAVVVSAPVGDVGGIDVAAAGSPEPIAGESNEEIVAEPEVKRIQRFGLYIIDLDLFLKTAKNGITPLQWAVSIKQKIEGDTPTATGASSGASKDGEAVEALPIRILFLSFESGPFKAENLRHDVIDDLVVKPLDRAMFLQKLELLIAEKPGTKPTFLFRQKTNEMIEAGKDAVIDEISDFAVAIRNPAPLQDGVYAAIHSDVFGSVNGRVVGRVYRSERHPTHEGEYLVRFAFFGPQAAQMLNVRKFVREHYVPMRLHQIPSAQKSVNASTKKPMKGANRQLAAEGAVQLGPVGRFAVIDMNQNAIADLKSTLEAHFQNVTVDAYPSYSRFLNSFMRLIAAKTPAPAATAPVSGAAPIPATGTAGAAKPHAPAESEEIAVISDDPAFPYADQVVFLATAETRALFKFEAPTSINDMILGRSAREWMENPESFLAAIDSEDKEEFLEFVDFVASGGKGQVHARIHDVGGKKVYIVAKGHLEKAADGDSPSIVQLEFKDIGKADWKEHVKARNNQSLDSSRLKYTAIFVDAGIVRTEFASWLEGLKGLMEKAGVIAAGEAMPKIILMAEEKVAANLEQYRVKSVADFMLKPLDRKVVREKIHAFFPTLQEKEPSEMPPFIPCEIPAKLGKDVIMEEISEYGLTILNNAALKPNIFMRFFSSHFGEANPGVIGRCSHSEKVEGDKVVSYRCHFTFFGTSDELFKRIRTWIREDYVHKKEGAGG